MAARESSHVRNARRAKCSVSEALSLLCVCSLRGFEGDGGGLGRLYLSIPTVIEKAVEGRTIPPVIEKGRRINLYGRGSKYNAKNSVRWGFGFVCSDDSEKETLCRLYLLRGAH
ncbi:hypothetical protein CYLTODRAFT_415501 [Cylindrobasidium torrendii FP15055 ss-10]|uniref:Uncharacterized protein n=1 Tax=Cylindrobasidium torrendii FP15055 ss-10 TaxID=1314674 RepID=A0A0D7ATL9_9AGAR|nr:hypothetical protein CYLTODRAFT_415501 [Cylindrobasidium torrendii FP15055 ss-10]